MKKIIYSSITKFLALLLLVASVLAALNFAIDGVASYTNEEPDVYGFEDSFENTSYFSWMLTEPVEYVCGAFTMYENDKDEFEKTHKVPLVVWNSVVTTNENAQESDTAESDIHFLRPGADTAQGGTEIVDVYELPFIGAAPAFDKTVYDYIEESLRNIYNIGKLNYYIKVNDRVFTNNSEMSMEDYMNCSFHVVAQRNDDGYVEFLSESGSHYYGWFYDLDLLDREYDITICTSIKEEYVTECEAIWHRQEGYIREIFVKSFGLALVALLMLIYLIAACGKNSRGESVSSWVDAVWVEIHLATISLAAFATIGCGLVILESTFARNIPFYMGKSVTLLAATLGGLLIVNSLLSIVRKLKNGSFAKTSIIIIVLKSSWEIFVDIIRALKAFFKHISKVFNKKSVIILVTLLGVYTTAVLFCGIFGYRNPGAFLPLNSLLFLLACIFVAYRARDIDEIRKGAQRIHSGELTYKIPELRSEDLRCLASNINDIAKGLDESVSAKMKAEKLKTDLITNVSHDLKTPLTSIISYTELLSKVEGLPDEARDYIGIIAKKSDRLKSLTQDLFDISKVQSGNERVELEKLDVALLINQSLGEHDNEINESGLPLIVSVDKELYINADGRKMSRVVSNLIGNILKYAMKNTRVFISANERDGKAVIEFKNISSYPMDFDAQEIIGRFVRGDQSRTTEGNGLGLAIAKSYTEACGGSFDVIIDGDLFKAVIKFDKV